MKQDYDIYEGSIRVRRMEASPIRTILDRAAALRAEGKKVIAFSAGEPNFNTPETIKRATIKAIENNETHYGSNRGTLELRKILSRIMIKETGISYCPDDEIFVTSSGAEAINNAILSFVEDGDEVVIFTPAFVSYKNLVKFAGGVVVEIPLKPENGFQIDIHTLEKAITDKTKMIILNNPNNPTGAVYEEATLEKLAETAIKHNLLVISDEMYSRLVYNGAQFKSIAAFEGMKERSIIVNGFSKTYAMTGWRLGYLLTDKRLGKSIIKMHQYSTTCSPTFIQRGLIESLELDETEDAVKHMLQVFSDRRKLVMEGLKKMEQLSFVQPDGAFYIMVNVSKTGMSGLEFAQRLLEEKNVATVPAIGLDGDCADFIRISYATSDEDIIEGLKRIEEFININ